ncbi:MAG: Dabb family protein [Gemmatimonadota bacterium]
MIHHIVLFKIKDATTAEQVTSARDALLAMKVGIPEIREIYFGPNLGPSAREYGHVLLVVCDDMDAVQRYLDHPLHRSTVDQFLAPIREARMAVDVAV